MTETYSQHIVRVGSSRPESDSGFLSRREMVSSKTQERLLQRAFNGSLSSGEDPNGEA